MTTLVARCGPNGTVICAQPSCRRELPGIWRMQPRAWDTDDQPYLFMVEGWQPGKDGVWRVTPRGRRGRAFLRGGVTDLRRHSQRDQVRSNSATPFDLEARPGSARGQPAADLPGVAVCPLCRTPQRLDPAVLDVVPIPAIVTKYAHPEDRQP